MSENNNDSNGNPFDTTPAPFFKQEIPAEEQIDAIGYDIHQFVKAGYLLEALGSKAPVGIVFEALTKLWEKQSVSLGETREEHAICAVHGWTLAEVYQNVMCVDVGV